jgi:hypothetical protein
MIPAACPRLFEAEAMRDGRLAGAERASFVRHTSSCAICRREVQALEALAAALRAPPGGGGRADELQRLRERTRLVAAFDRTLVAPRQRSGVMRRVLLPAAAAAMIAAAIFVGRAGLRPNVEPAPRVVVRPAAGAVWSKHPEADREKIVLERGELWIRVDHGRGATALIVELPDGELLDTGTTFTVSAADGRTTRVAVEEGSVSLRLRGRLPVAIGRAETWAAEPPTAPTPVPSAPAATGAPQRARATAPAPTVATRRMSAARPVALPDEVDPALDFRAAVALLDASANREAAAAFARFLAKHPRDPRAEDAAYLHVIALQRCGADDEMRRAAREYLRRYPAGFRRGEVEALSP